MNLRRFFGALASALLVFFATAPDAAAQPVRQGAVTVELVAHDASIQPGQPFWVALKIDHQEHWHTYWIAPGTGLPTEIAWELPAGFTAGPIVWPTPAVVKDLNGNVTGNGYEGRAFLFTQITPPADLAPESTVTLKARVDWLMCATTCVPGDAELKLTRPVKTGKPAPDMSIARLFNNAFANLPRASKDWGYSAQRAGKKITLRVAPMPGNTHRPEGLHYFDENAVVDYAAPQAVREVDGLWELELVAAADGPADATGLKGVLTSRNGFGPQGPGAVLIDEPFVVREPLKENAGTKTAATSGGDATGADDRSDSGAAGGSLLGTLFFAFLGGLVLNLMPCVFPVLGIKIMGFVNQAGSAKAKVVQHGLVFTAGVLVSFWALAGLLLVLRAGGEQLGWGFQLQSPAFVFGMAAFLLIFALNLSGLFEIGLSATGAGAQLQAKEGFAGSFFTGALATVVATPCSAPFLAPALGAALALSATQSLLVFTAIAVGLATPYLLLSIFPQAIRLLPRPGAWMETFKQFMAFPLYATVGWLLWVLAAQTAHDDYALLWIGFAFVLLAMAAWFYGRFGQTYGKPARQWFGRGAAVALTVIGLWMGWPKEAEAASATANNPAAYQVNWQKWSPEAVTAAQAAGKYIYVDFTARWCATCQTNKAAVFSSSEVQREFAQRDVVLLKADWTNKDPQITQELAKWNRSAVPFNLLYTPQRGEPVVLPELLTGGKVLEALAQAERG